MAKPVSAEEDPDLHRGFGEFTLPNGDTYAGDYCAHRSGVLWREGQGVYTTRDGQVYEGQWSDDRLVDNKEVLITYPNGAQYSGPLVKNKYHGPGTYILESNMNISCQFEANKPVGTVTLIDCQGRLWRGTAEENSAILLPENVFYLNLNEYKGRGVSKRPIDITAMLPSPSKCSAEDDENLSDREWEKIIFAKSKLTENDVDFTDCKWWKNYENYRQKYDEIANKINEGTSLDDEDYIWIERFNTWKRTQQLRKDQKQANWNAEEAEVFGLNEKFQSKDFQTSCPGIKVFYPQQDEINNRRSNSEQTITVGDSNIIYVNSTGEITNPTKEVMTSSDSVLPQPSSKIEHSQEEDISAVQFDAPAGSSKTHAALRRCIIPLLDNSEEVSLHFNSFREEVLLERKSMLRKEEKYQADKTRGRSKDSVISKDKSERGSTTKSKDGDLIKLAAAKPETVVNPPKDFRAKIEMKVKECVDKFLASRKARVEKLKKISEQIVDKPHTHDVVADTESITGIPRDLLLGNKSP